MKIKKTIDISQKRVTYFVSSVCKAVSSFILFELSPVRKRYVSLKYLQS